MNSSQLVSLVSEKGPATTANLLQYTPFTKSSLSARLTALKSLGLISISKRIVNKKGGREAVWGGASEKTSLDYVSTLPYKTAWVGGNPFRKTNDSHQSSTAS